MSRIRDALSKHEGAPRPVERSRYEHTAYAEPSYAGYAAPVFDDAVPPPFEAEASPQAIPAPTTSAEAVAELPGLPAEFHRELSGLRFTLEGALADRVTRVVQFSAAVPGEGTTTVATNFARVLSQDPSQNVLLVDANVRRPGVATFFGLSEQDGLAGILRGDMVAEATRQLVAVERPNLHVLAGGPLAADGMHLFPPDALREFWRLFGRHYHWVVVDAPAVLEAPETAILGGTVDTTVLVVQAARTKRGVVQRAMDACAKAGAPVLGVVLNRRRLDIPEFIYRRI